MKEVIARRSAAQNFSSSRLPEFTTEEIEYIKGTADYLGINSYTSFLAVEQATVDYNTISWGADTEYGIATSNWTVTSNGWLSVSYVFLYDQRQTRYLPMSKISYLFRVVHMLV